MDPDLFLTIGIVLIVLTIPTLLAAWVEGRAPRVGAIMLIAALGLVLVAVTQQPGGYTFNEVPDVFLRVFARLTN
ncbi:hypothetical protein [Tabrizicola sp.]|uniref:hypothetical protein n=1 Tax=Tabrizicola sp. TaxID=2005166 RepID=UPI00286D0F70|nr:hypothetical protein [Tabrizicola sp.]